MNDPKHKELVWIGSTKEDLKKFPAEVRSITTPKADIDLINARLKRAKEFHEREGKP